MGKWEMVRLGDVADFNMGQSPSSDFYNAIGEGIPFFQGKTDFGIMYPIVRMYCTDPKKIAKENDILMSVRAPVGAVNIAKETCCIGRGLAAISQKDQRSANKYLYYYFKYKESDIANMGVGSTFKAISKKDLCKIELPFPPLPVQQKIADMLDKVSALIEKRKAQIEKLDLLVKAQFIEMFGDPVTNPKGWELSPLMQNGTCKNGMNFRSNESGISIHCLGVGDFKDLSIINNVQYLSEINLYEMPSMEYLLRDEDIVFVRSNGNKALVGRCLVIYPGDIPTTYSGFCIRYRKSSDSIHIKYLLQVLKSPSIRLQMAGRGANIQNLNQQMLSQLNIPIPPLKLQNEFADFVQQVEAQKTVLQQSLEKFELNYKSLMQKCFRGEVF